MTFLNRLIGLRTGAGILALGISLSFLLASDFSEAQSPAQGAAAEDKTFTFRLIGEPETLDWNKAHTPVENYLMINLMEGLLLLDADLQVKPALAESYKKSADGKTFTFKLRPGVKWSDGVPLKAKDFVYSWKRVLSPDTAASYAYLLFDIENAEEFYKGKLKDFSKVGVKALNDSTLQVKLKRPAAHWVYIPTFWPTFPLREDVVKKHGSAWVRPGNMVTVGPYTLQSHEVDSRIVLKANPNYYGKRGNVGTAIAQIVKDDSTALSLYESGRLDYVTDIPSLDLQRLSSMDNLKSFPYLKTGYLGLVTTQAPTSNVKVRKAIAMAIDKTKFAQLLFGKQQPGTSFVPPQMLAYAKSIGLPYNPAEAKKLLKESGADLSKPVTITIPNWDRPVILSQYLQAELKRNLGLTVKVQPFDHKTFRSQIDMKAFSSFILSWGADYPDPDNFLSMWLSNSGNNRVGFKNAKYDQLIEKGRVLQDPKQRRDIYLEAQKILLEEEAAVVPLYYDTNTVLVADRVKNFELSPINYVYFKNLNMAR